MDTIVRRNPSRELNTAPGRASNFRGLTLRRRLWYGKRDTSSCSSLPPHRRRRPRPVRKRVCTLNETFYSETIKNTETYVRQN